jgi:N-methylhydantoinase A/acetone carboxylase beta subunit
VGNTEVRDKAARRLRILGIDAGGTMTDTFIIDDRGEFVIGKAQTTPQDESIGFMASARDAMKYWGLSAEQGFPQLQTGIYSGTAMLNRLLERKGRRVGVLVSGGMEDYLRMERAIQTYLGYSYADRVHVATHHHNDPIVPRERLFGIRGRIDVLGKEAIPLYRDEVRAAVASLLAHNVEAIVVCFLFSYKNPAHERLARTLAEATMRERGVRVPVYLSSDLYPVRRDFPRLNSTLLEAYAAEPSRASLERVRSRTREAGGRFDLRIMASHGGTISMDASELARTMISGPIGGVIGSRYLGEAIGVKNLACTDIGGTSFDIALVTDGAFGIKQNPDVGRFLLNMPLVRIDSIGAGTGSFVRINPTSSRIEIGPDSAGARIGMCWSASGLDTVTITDCSVALGYVNPDYFLGGELRLDRERAVEAIRRELAGPLGIDVFHAAHGVLQLFEDNLRSALLGQILGKGYGPESFTLLSYGGGGPLHVGGYSDGLAFEDVLVPAWAPAFSAFGCACGDYEYRFDRTLDLPLRPSEDAAARERIAGEIDGAWRTLREQAIAEFAKSGVPAGDIRFKPAVRMLYYGQLNDLEVPSPLQRLERGEDLELLARGFEDLYGRMYGLAARTPQFGYLITGAFMCASVEVEKPRLPEEEERAAAPERAANKGERDIYWCERWYAAAIFELERLHAGNVIEGPAVVESPASTLLVPPGRSARLDAHRIFHLSCSTLRGGRPPRAPRPQENAASRRFYPGARRLP